MKRRRGEAERWIEDCNLPVSFTIISPWIRLCSLKIQSNTPTAVTGKRGIFCTILQRRYKKRPNDDFEWYYDYETLKDIFCNHFEDTASISFKISCSSSISLTNTFWLWVVAILCYVKIWQWNTRDALLELTFLKQLLRK